MCFADQIGLLVLITMFLGLSEFTSHQLFRILQHLIFWSIRFHNFENYCISKTNYDVLYTAKSKVMAYVDVLIILHMHS